MRNSRYSEISRCAVVVRATARAIHRVSGSVERFLIDIKSGENPEALNRLNNIRVSELVLAQFVDEACLSDEKPFN